MFAVVFETRCVTKTLFTGSMDQCKQYLRTHKDVCGDDIFVTEVDQECVA